MFWGGFSGGNRSRLHCRGFSYFVFLVVQKTIDCLRRHLCLVDVEKKQSLPFGGPAVRAPPTFETARYSLTISELGGWGPTSHAMVCGRARVWMITAEGRLQWLMILAHLIGPILLSGSHSRCAPRNLFAVANQHLALEHERPVGRGR